MSITSQPIKEFFSLTYNELEKRNLEFKKERKEGKNQQYFFEKVTKLLKNEEKIKAVAICFSDIEGKFLYLDYDKNFILKSHDNLTFDGSSIRGFSTQDKSDLRLKIDWSSFRFLPSDIFGSGKVIMFANVYDVNENVYESDFRGRLRHICEKYREDNTIINIAPEIEGFLFNGVDAEQHFQDVKSFSLVTNGGYFNSLPQDKLRLFIDMVAEAKRAMGFENEKDHPEVAPSQFELNYKYTDALEAADQVQLYKLTCRQVAKLLGCTASFLPKPVMNINGSGMHVNISVEKNGKNLFYEKNESLSEIGNRFANSILSNAKDLCLIINSSVNAYRRLDPKFEAPNEIKISQSDRSSMIRIPDGNEASTRIEVRSVAPDSNPYLTFYSLIKIGMKAVEEKNDNFDVLSKREKLPANIYDAIRYFKTSKLIKEIIGETPSEKFCDIKEEAANRSPKNLGSVIKDGEIIYHHEITNQMLWYNF